MAPSPAPDHAHPTTFLVVFEDRPPRGVLRWLRPGFRHCFCLVRRRGGWVVCDPRAERLVLDLAPEITTTALARAYATLGARVVALRERDKSEDAHRVPLRLRPLTCVELVKKLLGRRLGAVFTPHQLYLRLLRDPTAILYIGPEAQ